MMHGLLSVAAATALSLSPSPDEPATNAAVESAIREYVTAKYKGDVDTVRSRAHHDIARKTVASTYWGRPSDEWVKPYSHDVLQFYGTRLNEVRLESPDQGRCEIEVFDTESRSAAAVVVMEDVVDFLHLALFEGRWVIADSSVIILGESGAEPAAPSTEATDAVREVIRDYCLGFYEIDGDKVQSTCHSGLSKRVVESWREGEGFDFFRGITWEEIRILGETFNRSLGFDPAKARCEIDVYQIRENVAIAKLTGSVWFDYLQLMNVNDEWKIVNILFESLPEERSESPG